MRIEERRENRGEERVMEGGGEERRGGVEGIEERIWNSEEEGE